MAALVAGVPQVVVPLFSADQFANADQLAAVRAGVALQVEDAAERLAGSMLPAGPDVLDRLPEAVSAALHDPGLRSGAGAVAAEIGTLPEVAESVTVLEQLPAARS
jgi:UDP:flavonoid glycosyltransferase YjiC (YdhE family)